ncbi:MAG: phenylacetate--CoA ligase family protein, partial [Candidatus Dormibacteraceae bacterium]
MPSMMSAREAWRHVVRKHLHIDDTPGNDVSWAPVVECASRDQLREIQNEKLVALVRFLYEESAGYRRIFDEHGLEPGDIRTVDDLVKIPMTTRQDLAQDQARSAPWGELPPVTDELWRHDGWLFFSTSGTTGTPVAFRVTGFDREGFVQLYIRALYAGGIRTGHSAFNCFSYGPFSAFWGAHLALNRLGCPVIPGGGMDSRRRGSFIARFRPSIVIGTPTYLFHLAEIMREEKLDASQVGAQFLVTAGEAGPCLAATRARLRAAWGGAQILDNYGCTEVAPAPLGYTCAVQSEREGEAVDLHLTEDMYIVEVVDPETGKAVPAGTRGVLVCTNLWSEGQAFLRYRIGDY